MPRFLWGPGEGACTPTGTARISATRSPRSAAKLPMMKVSKEYSFEGANGVVGLPELFGDKRQLIVYHFMFDPQWDEGCKSCSYLADNLAPSAVHLAPFAKIAAFKQRMGWTFPWFSSNGNSFNYDFHVTLDKALGSNEYNYEDADVLRAKGEIWEGITELPGLSVFLRDGDEIFHTYSTYQRGLDLLLNTYNYLDLTPLGRQEEADPFPMMWLRHHDRYTA